MADDDEDDEGLGGAFADGHWIWDDINHGLIFVSHIFPQLNEPQSVLTQMQQPSAFAFRDNVELMDQIRFRRRYQRKVKPGQPEVITLQDIKDVALFTAPGQILSLMLINILHVPATERLLRALIFYFQYFTQIYDVMNRRMEEANSKIRLPISDLIENEFRNNLCDLRTLVAKEYCAYIIGDAEMRKFHHMGPNKKRRSLTDMDTRLSETLLRFMLQIVWLALNRKYFNLIEHELNRIFRTSAFNVLDHRIGAPKIKLSPEESNVFHGPNISKNRKLNLVTPLLMEVHCTDDYRLLALGILGFKEHDARLNIMEAAIAAPEENLKSLKVPLGIIGLPRNRFDTMLIEVKPAKDDKRSTISSLKLSSVSKKSMSTSKFYEAIILEPRTGEIPIPDVFPDLPATYPIRHCNNRQRKRWIHRFLRTMALAGKSLASTMPDTQRTADPYTQ